MNCFNAKQHKLHTHPRMEERLRVPLGHVIIDAEFVSTYHESRELVEKCLSALDEVDHFHTPEGHQEAFNVTQQIKAFLEKTK